MLPSKQNNNLPLLALLPIQLTQYLNGEGGKNRVDPNSCQIRANNDYEALQCWLNEYRHKSTTFRTYQKEGERFLLWCVFQQQKPLSSIDRDDVEAYLNFLNDPQPREKWCGAKGGRGRKRGDNHWRPFTGPLSKNAKMTAVSSIDSLFTYLVQARYLAFNPLSLIRKRYANQNPTQMNSLLLSQRMLSIEEWYAMLSTLEEWPEATIKENKEKQRLIFLVNILYFLGIRIQELATHRWNAFCKIENEWWFYVVGKGDKPGRIPVNSLILL